MKGDKTYRVTLVWDGTEHWEVRARNKKEAVDQAELGVGKLLGGPCGYELEKTVVEEVKEA
jgi:hypothetical protein